ATGLVRVLAVPGINQIVDLVQVEDTIPLVRDGDEQILKLVRAVGIFEHLHQVAHHHRFSGLARDAAHGSRLSGSRGREQQESARLGIEIVEPFGEAGELRATVQIAGAQVPELHETTSLSNSPIVTTNRDPLPSPESLELLIRLAAIPGPSGW